MTALLRFKQVGRNKWGLQEKLEKVSMYFCIFAQNLPPLCSCLYCPWANSQYVLYKVSWDIHLSMGHLRHNLRVPARQSLSSAPVKVRKVPTIRSYKIQCNLDLSMGHLHHNLRVPARQSLSSTPVKVRKVPTIRSSRCNLDLVTLHLVTSTYQWATCVMIYECQQGRV